MWKSKINILFAVQLLFQVTNKAHSQDVEGWEIEKSRYSANYIIPDKITTLLSGSNICPKSQIPDVLIIACSFVGNYELRAAIRSTWGQHIVSRYKVSIGFFLGQSEEGIIDHTVLIENDKYKDMIVENFIDNGNNSTMMTLMLFKWVNINCLGTKYLIKSSDNVYIIMKNLVKYLDDLKTTYEKSDFLVGWLVSPSPVNRDPYSERFVPKYMYDKEEYPNYLNGDGAYMMSLPTCRGLYNVGLMSQMIHLEDVFITGMCAKKAGIKPMLENKFVHYNSNVTFECVPPHIDLIVHSNLLTPRMIHRRHEQILSCLSKLMH